MVGWQKCHPTHRFCLNAGALEPSTTSQSQKIQHIILEMCNSRGRMIHTILMLCFNILKNLTAF